MKNIAQSLLMVGLVFTLASIAPAKTVKKYKSKEGKMSVVFAGAYEVNTDKGDSYTTTKISSSVSEIVYFASFTQHTEPLTDREELCQVSLDSFNETLNGDLSNQRAWNISGSKGITADIYLAEQQAKIQYRVVIIGQIQYQFAVIAPKDDWNGASAEAFMKSIKLKK